MYNNESVDNPTNPYFENSRAPNVAKDEVEFFLEKHKISEFFRISAFMKTYKKMKKFTRIRLKCTIKEKLDAEEVPHIEGYVNQKYSG